MEIEGMEIVGLSTDQEACLQARGVFFKEYCKNKGWPIDADKLNIDQILEIRTQDGWKNPAIEPV